MVKFSNMNNVVYINKLYQRNKEIFLPVGITGKSYVPFTTVDLVNSVISDLETMQMTGCSEFMIELSICSAEPDKATEEGSSWGIL